MPKRYVAYLGQDGYYGPWAGAVKPLPARLSPACATRPGHLTHLTADDRPGDYPAAVLCGFEPKDGMLLRLPLARDRVADFRQPPATPYRLCANCVAHIEEWL